MNHIEIDPNLFLLEEEAVYMINFLSKASSKHKSRYEFDQNWVRHYDDIKTSCTTHNLDIYKIARSIVDIAWSVEKQIELLSDILNPNDIDYWRIV